MTAIKINVDARGLEKRLAKFLRVLDGQILLRVVAARQEAWIDENFRREGLERKWKPLRPGTVYARRKASRAVLQDTGRLRGSFSARVGSTRSVVGTADKRAIFHDEGTKPYDIRPKKGKFLTIPGAAGPVTFSKGKLAGLQGWFSKGVRHPGLPARPLLPTKALAERLAAKTIEATLRKAGAN